MVIIDEARPKCHQRQCHEEEQVRRIAYVGDRDSVPKPDSESEIELGEYCYPVFGKIGC